MHIVVAGEQEAAVRIAESLMQDHNVAFICKGDSNIARLDALDIAVVNGSPTSATTLRDAGVEQAEFFIAASDDDERNIVSCLAAQRVGANRTICFLNSVTGLQFEVDEESSLAESIGITSVVRPTDQLAEEIIRIVTVPGALDVRSFHSGRVRLLKCSVPANAPIVGVELKEVELPRGARLAMVQRGSEFFLPTGTTKIQADDRVTSLGTKSALKRLHAWVLGRPPKKKMQRHQAFICGGGMVGLSVAKGLREVGWMVKMIEANRERCEELAHQLNCMVLHGDGSDLDLLEQEHIAEADALIAVTNNDEKNLLISLVAKSLGVPRIITRADRPANEKLFEKVGIDVVLSARGAAIRSVIGDIVQERAMHLADLEHGDFGVFELELPEEFEPIPLYKLRPPKMANIGAILRGRRTIIPMGSDELQPLDHVLVICRTAEEQETRHYLTTPSLWAVEEKKT